MKWAVAIALVAMCAGALPYAAAPVKPKSTAAKSSQTKSRPAVHGKSTAHGRRRVPPPPAYQLHPDPDRYQQIQKALADKGYFHGEVNGEWNDDSVAALRRFQADQNLPDDGKISALSLIGLGLGPKHNGNLNKPSGAATNPAPVSTPPSLTSSDAASTATVHRQ